MTIDYLNPRSELLSWCKPTLFHSVSSPPPTGADELWELDESKPLIVSKFCKYEVCSKLLYLRKPFSKCFLSLSTSIHSEEALEHLRRANKHGRSWDNLYPITLCREFLSVNLWVTLNIIRITCAEPGFVWINGKQALVSILS